MSSAEDILEVLNSGNLERFFSSRVLAADRGGWVTAVGAFLSLCYKTSIWGTGQGRVAMASIR